MGSIIRHVSEIRLLVFPMVKFVLHILEVTSLLVAISELSEGFFLSFTSLFNRIVL